MHPTKLSTRIAAAAFLAITATASQAALTTYTTTASFAAATTSAVTDTFDTIPVEDISSPFARTLGDFAYSASAPDGLFGIYNSSDAWLGTNISFNVLSFTTFTGGVQGIGGNFFATDDNGATLAQQTVVVTVTDSSGAVSQSTLADASETGFVGFTTNGTIVSLTVETTTNPAIAFATANNLVLATAPVPEPATYGMLLAGLGALAFLRRRCDA